MMPSEEPNTASPVCIFYASMEDDDEGTPQIERCKSLEEAKQFVGNLVSGSTKYLVHTYVGEPVPLSELLPPDHEFWAILGGDS